MLLLSLFRKRKLRQEGFEGVTGGHRQAVSSCSCALYRLTLCSQPCCFDSFCTNNVATCCAVRRDTLFSVPVPAISSSTFATLSSCLTTHSRTNLRPYMSRASSGGSCGAYTSIFPRLFNVIFDECVRILITCD